MIKIKRAYDLPDENDGFRILIERVWPKNLPKKEAKINLWLKSLGATKKLEKLIGKEEKWPEFREKYKEELEKKKTLLKKIKILEKEKTVVTLIYSSSDQRYNCATVLQKLIKTNPEKFKYFKDGLFKRSIR